MSAALLLSKLCRVRKYGAGWRADCPNGHNKTHGSLSVIEADDGRVMIHCFACNDTPAFCMRSVWRWLICFPSA